MDDQNQTPAPAPVNPAPVEPAAPVSAPSEGVAPLEDDVAPETATSVIKKVAEGSSVVPKGEKLLAMFGYIQFLCVLPLALKPKSKYCQFHGKQSLVLVLVFFILSWIGWVAKGFGMLIAFVHIAIIIVAMVQASQGKLWRIPFVAQVADKLNWDE
jgi:uncharacterized membrane protein